MRLLTDAGELCFIKEMNKRGYFYQYLSNHKGHDCDFIVFKNNKIARVEIKHTRDTKRKIFYRDSTGNKSNFLEKIDFFIVVQLKSSYCANPCDFWVFKVSDRPAKNIKIDLGNTQNYNNFTLLDSFFA